MNQQQLQFARAALWHQTAPLLTADEATTWLEDLGLCLFLPRHAQLPAPAPSFVEAVHGAASAAPPAAALDHAGELTARLVEERRAIPLNLLGTYSEQADFLVTPEVLPWVAATRGDRQWNTAPGGRTAPLVMRTWEVLDRDGETTAVELRATLGRELTEAAVLRALIELWTSVRAMPVYKPGEPTRWTLLKHRFPAQLTTGANTGQATGVSALLSIYLRSAVAATAEEAEIYLSPLTARSRIREVIHGMTAARQFGSMSVASQTLLFVEGSLPEDLPIEEAPTADAAAPAGRAPRPPRPPFRKEFQDKRRPSRPAGAPGRAPRPSFQERRPEKRGTSRPWERSGGPRRPDRPEQAERPSAESRPRTRDEGRPGIEKRPGAKPWERRPAFRRPDRPTGEGRPPARPRFAAGDGRPPAGGKRPFDSKRPGDAKRPGAKPWERRPAVRRPDRPAGEERPPARPRFAAGGGRPPAGGKRPFDSKRPGDGKRPGAKPWERRPAVGRPDRPTGEGRPPVRPRSRPGVEQRPGGQRPPIGAKRTGARPWQRREAGAAGGRREDRGPRVDGEARSEQSSGQRPIPRSGQRPGPKGGFRPSGPKRFGGKAPGAKPFGGGRAKFPPRREAGGATAGGGAPGRARPSGPGKGTGRREDSRRPFAQGETFKGPARKNFRKASPGERNPRKNRSQEEKPE